MEKSYLKNATGEKTMTKLNIDLDINLEQVKELRKELEKIRDLKKEINDLEKDGGEDNNPLDLPEPPQPSRRPRFWLNTGSEKTAFEPFNDEKVKAETSFQV